jgi:phospholipid/cholesterol/gamma-HCH transport system substrate-binding protein
MRLRRGKSTGSGGGEPARVPRKDRRGASPVKVGLLVLVGIVAVTYFAFSKHVPFTHGFRVKAVFESANSIRTNSPVRIAGVNVGKVTAIARQPGTDTAIVTMELDDRGLPLHKDATAKIRPRIFLEGNFFVDLQPGTPATPTIDDGDTLPVTQTATPVQLDQVLSALRQDTRRDLQRLVRSLGTALTFKPSKAADADADPSARGESAAESLNDSIRFGRDALRGTAEVTDALTGTQPRDLSQLIAGLRRVTEGLSRDEEQLGDLVVALNTTMAATASQATSLGTSIRRLGPTLVSADRALDSLNAAFPSTRAFAREILPGVRETAATIDAGFPWIAQTRALLGPDELRGLVRELTPASADLSRVIDTSIDLFPQLDLAAKCATRVVLPAGNVRIQDGPFSTGAENYKEFWYAMVGLAGEGQNFDGNGQYVRFQPGGGSHTISVPTPGSDVGPRLFGNAIAAPLGSRPRFPGRLPPYNPTTPCFTNRLPDVDGAATGPADALP